MNESVLFQLVLTYHDHRFKHLNFDYIYPISYKIAKKQIPQNGSALTEKRYHNQVKRCQNERYIAEITGHEFHDL